MERIKPHKAMSRKNNDNHEPEKQKRLTPVRATISEKWLKPRKIVKRIDRASNKHWSVVSFFAGCGGLDLGFLGGFSYNGTGTNSPISPINLYPLVSSTSALFFRSAMML